MNFIRKNASEFQQGYTGFYLKPAVCPHCGTGTDAVSTAREVFAFSANANLLLSSVKCTSCSKTFFFANLRESGNTDAEVVCIYPSLAKEYTNDTLEKISPRFIAMYNQSLRSEKAGDTERRLVFKNPKIRIGTGRPEWGAERGKNYFVITWEE